MNEQIRRNFDVHLERADGDERILGGCCVPYNRPTTVSDGGAPYREMFVPGAFTPQLGAADRVELRYQHGVGLLERIGRAVSLEERGDGLWGTFRVFGTNAGDQALTLVDEGLLTGLSISGLPKRSGRAPDGTVIRQRVHLDEVSLCDAPAYVGAEVTVRRCTRVELELPDLPDDEQLERLRAVGIVIGR